MNNVCQFEQETIQAVKSGVRNERLQHHSETCPLCRETVLITQSLVRIREEAFQYATAIPPYRVLWLKAQFTQRQEQLSKLDLVTLLGLSLVAAITFIGIMFWKIPRLQEWNISRLFDSSSGWISSLPLNIPVAIVIVFMIAVWMFSLEFYFTKRT